MREKRSGKKSFYVISNRLPVSISKKKNQLKIQESPGGLATGLRALERTQKPRFVGWPGHRPVNDKEKEYIKRTLEEKHRSHPVFLTSSDVDKYYYGFSNKTLWPLFHYFPTYCTFEESEWRAYRRVNSKFFEKVAELSKPRDSFWIHDYHLMLLPAMIREVFPQSTIGFFLHIPFPSSEVFRVFPWRREILKGLLGADLIGFHTFEYARHFLSSVLRLLGYEHEFGTIQIEDRIIRVENFPMGIDFKNQEALLENSSVQEEIKSLSRKTESGKKKIILSVDRMDYSKGIPQRLEGLEYFLAHNPQWHERFVYMMLCVPSRTKVVQYSLLKEEVDSLIGRINGRFGKPGWIPIHYMYRSLPFHKLIPLYAIADVALVTPLRDGMNLVAKEYVATRKDEKGVLILSETAGASAELGEALHVNVNDKKDISEAIKIALEMSLNEQKERMQLMRKRLSDYDIISWTRSFVDDMREVKKIQSQRIQRKLNENWQKRMISDYQKSQNRLLLLDYDGTLIAFTTKPEQAKPDTELIR
ncbi:MAG: bifunctional alpha,alpha-trehalose-phosphate synthase (UDP-forming)/trehalose-phosphatase, partial [Acidobacteriota bacterium]